MTFLLDHDAEFDLEFGHLVTFSSDVQVNSAQIWSDASTQDSGSFDCDGFQSATSDMEKLEIAKNRRAEALSEARDTRLIQSRAVNYGLGERVQALQLSSTSPTQPLSPLSRARSTSCSLYVMNMKVHPLDRVLLVNIPY
ncbi:hypothetical protein K435DRAFT_974357 [Dendrothele bispora CBS 962.96]|uniref:Uncharacterized protein n=1 Tax=Dendrothele bispora (strain CBS 962.96) TaxID=1314807 RepID=A0A4S8KLX7_DENBC|nr:hypothetical protein K435DRAFT_974357 [Dendrothele bispora CBS 962.96]